MLNQENKIANTNALFTVTQSSIGARIAPRPQMAGARRVFNPTPSAMAKPMMRSNISMNASNFQPEKKDAISS